MWDGIVRGTGVMGLLGIVLVLTLRHTGPLVGLAIYTTWISGPLSPFFPIGLEPVLMLFGRLYPPLLVAGVSTTAGLYVEFLNYHLYGKLLHLEATHQFRESRVVRFLRRIFERSPFFTVWICAITPLPFWAARILASLSGYPIQRYLGAALLGRFPKLWFFSALGLHWSLNEQWLLGIAGGSVLLGAAPWAISRWRQRRVESKVLRLADPDTTPAARPGAWGGR